MNVSTTGEPKYLVIYFTATKFPKSDLIGQ